VTRSYIFILINTVGIFPVVLLTFAIYFTRPNETSIVGAAIFISVSVAIPMSFQEYINMRLEFHEAMDKLREKLKGHGIISFIEAILFNTFEYNKWTFNRKLHRETVEREVRQAHSRKSFEVTESFNESGIKVLKVSTLNPISTEVIRSFGRKNENDHDSDDEVDE